MSMAMPKFKSQMASDPRNMAWVKNENKFGEKMLRKMGWSRGNGLGAQQQGTAEHVRVSIKNNNLGEL